MAYCEDYPCCGHTDQDPCERQWYDEELTECPEGCTDVEIVEGGSSVGFSGAPIYWTNYSCGHQEVDAGADVLET